MTLDPEAIGGPLLRRHVADLVFTYTGAEPGGGHTDISVQLVASGGVPGEPRDKGGAKARLPAQIRVGSPYFVRGNIAARYDPLPDGTHLLAPPAISDVSLIFQYLMSAGDLPCHVAADVNASGKVDLTDAVMLLGYLFSSGPPPSAPFPGAGWLSDYDRDLGCERSLPYYSTR
jgi:hypothetical protein